ncbi:MAG: sulfatase, partial [Planctomycetes bacterium]|nr:sulfatase [Planctomycetota bacterium]
ETAKDSPRPRLSVLFIASDDLRPDLGCYGKKEVLSPSIDRIAASGLLFTRAYCQQAVCSPSRTSLLTGLRPDSTKVYDLETHFRTTVPDVVTLPEQFRTHGYRSVGLGKIFHGGLNDDRSWDQYDAASGPGWFLPENKELLEQKRREARAKGLKGTQLSRAVRGPAWESADVPDSEYPDGILTDAAIRQLRELKDKPFFLAVGYRKPHLPFIAPKKYWDLYDPAKIELSPIVDPPKDAPPCALTDWGELRAYHGIPRKGRVTDEQARNLIHGYRACISFIDAGIGRLLDEIEKLGLAESTIVILWGDHGWKLGEYSAWCKHTNFELDTRVPLLIRAPGMKARGRRSRALVEYVDIYPTLCELAGLPRPAHLEGTSFAPLLDDPERAWKSAAFSQYPRSLGGVGPIMGYSMRTDRHHLVRWVHRGQPAGEAVALELYDHETDPMETVNVAARPDLAGLVEKLSAQCIAGWKAARPAAAPSPPR